MPSPARSRSYQPARARRASVQPRQMRELHPQAGRLDRVHPVIETLDLVPVLLALAPVPQPACRLGQLRTVGDDRTALAAGAQVLAGVEAEAAEIADRADAAALVLGAMRLGRVLDHHQTVGVGEHDQLVHRRRRAVQMDRHDRSGPRRSRRGRPAPGRGCASAGRCRPAPASRRHRGWPRPSRRRSSAS